MLTGIQGRQKLQSVSAERGLSMQTICITWLLEPSRTPHAMYACSYRSYLLPLFPFLSLEIILVDLICHHHHPQQKHRPNNIECKRRLPILTYPLRLQPRQRRLPVRQARTRPVEIAVAVYGARGPVELDGGFDQAGEEEHEEDEGAEDDDAREQLPLLD